MRHEIRCGYQHVSLRSVGRGHDTFFIDARKWAWIFGALGARVLFASSKDFVTDTTPCKHGVSYNKLGQLPLITL